MLDESNPMIAMKLDVLRAAMPAESAIVFGDMFVVEGAYTRKCLEYGCSRAVLVDTFETAGWLEARAADPRLDFFKANFADPMFMASLRERFSLSVAFDILLHQPPLLATLHMILEKTADAIAIVQPVLKEQEVANSLVYLPGQPEDCGLYPVADGVDYIRTFDVEQVNQSYWIWGMTPSFIRSVLRGEGFELRHEMTGPDLENPRWHWWGAVARRVSDNPAHWSQLKPMAGLYEPTW